MKTALDRQSNKANIFGMMRSTYGIVNLHKNYLMTDQSYCPLLDEKHKTSRSFLRNYLTKKLLMS